jgi:hypothetical protein
MFVIGRLWQAGPTCKKRAILAFYAMFAAKSKAKTQRKLLPIGTFAT